MTELKDPTSDGSSAAAAAPAGADPLARLHHMSTTAGITTQEYVAINLPAIVTTVLGLASVVAFLHMLLLIVPAIAVVVGIIALRQIRESNGTQTGRPFALGGIVLAVLIGGGLVANAAYVRFSSKSDERVILDQVNDLAAKLKSRDYTKAYELFNDRFKARIKFDAFEGRFKLIAEHIGGIRSFEWNGVPAQFEVEPSSGTRMGIVICKAQFEKTTDAARWRVLFRNSGDGWMIDDLPDVFPADKAPRNQTPRGPGPMGP